MHPINTGQEHTHSIKISTGPFVLAAFSRLFGITITYVSCDSFTLRRYISLIIITIIIIIIIIIGKVQTEPSR